MPPNKRLQPTAPNRSAIGDQINRSFACRAPHHGEPRLEQHVAPLLALGLEQLTVAKQFGAFQFAAMIDAEFQPMNVLPQGWLRSWISLDIAVDRQANAEETQDTNGPWSSKVARFPDTH